LVTDKPLAVTGGHVMGGLRRSRRIKKEISIVLLVTDTQGQVFSEETRTVALSYHGAGSFPSTN
jgi:hypothetical protein